MEQAIWTVISGTFVIAIGKIIESLCIQPYISYRKVVGEITYQLVFYAQTYSSKMMKEKFYQEASEKFRISASRLQVYFNTIEWMNLNFIPTRNEIDKATNSLIGLSNSIPPSTEDFKHNLLLVKAIRKMLRIKFYEE